MKPVEEVQHFETPQSRKDHPVTICSECRGMVEGELLAVSPSARICLDCMEEGQRRRLEEDLRLVQETNRALLPRRLPPARFWDMGIHYLPSRILSGDFYDLLTPAPLTAPVAPLWPDSFGLAVGDVCGKGLPAALLRTSLQATLRALSLQERSPAEVLEEANCQFLDASRPGRFASVFYGVLGPRPGLLVYANGGHLPPLLRRASGRWEVLQATGAVLGVLERLRYEQRSCSIEPGDMLVLYTDGVTETESGSGEFFGEARLVEMVDRWVEAPAREIAGRVAEALDRFSAGEPVDDRTLMVLRRLPGDGSLS
ncbi:MAG: PP2C family protein-serine/threonine phosphatase [Acidobacteriota bacterium]